MLSIVLLVLLVLCMQNRGVLSFVNDAMSNTQQFQSSGVCEMLTHVRGSLPMLARPQELLVPVGPQPPSVVRRAFLNGEGQRRGEKRELRRSAARAFSTAYSGGGLGARRNQQFRCAPPKFM